MEAHVVWGDGEPFKSDILDHYVHTHLLLFFWEEGIANFPSSRFIKFDF